MFTLVALVESAIYCRFVDGTNGGHKRRGKSPSDIWVAVPRKHLEHYWTAWTRILSLGYSDEWILAVLLGRDNGNIWDSRQRERDREHGRKTSGASVWRECFT